MDFANLRPRYKKKTTNNLIIFSILGSLVLHLLIIGSIKTRQSNFNPENKSKRPTLKITVQPRLFQTPPELPVRTQDINNDIRSEAIEDNTSSPQVPSQRDIPLLPPRKTNGTTSNNKPKIDPIRLREITREVVNKLIHDEHKKSPKTPIVGENRFKLGEDLYTLPELNQALKLKHTSVQKFADGMIQITLPNGKSYCIRETEWIHDNSPNTPPPIATNCP